MVSHKQVIEGIKNKSLIRESGGGVEKMKR